MKKLMTEEENKKIQDEFEMCKIHIDYLKGEFDSEKDHRIRMDIINEMISEADKMAKLDTLLKRVALKNFKSDVKKIIKMSLVLLKTSYKTNFNRK